MICTVAEWLHPPMNESCKAVTLIARNLNQDQSMLELGSNFCKQFSIRAEDGLTFLQK